MRFVSIQVFRALHRTAQGEQLVLWEQRIGSDSKTLLFTQIDSQEIYTLYVKWN
jgi:hypothetical protein